MERPTPSPELVAAAARRWGLGACSLRRSVESFIYEADRDGAPVILRLTEPTHRSLAQLRSELDWVRFLRGRGLPVVEPLAADDGELAVEVEAGREQAFAAAFVRLPGQQPTPLAAGQEATWTAWGRLLAQLHAATRDYVAAPGTEPRPAWSERDWYVWMEDDCLRRDPTFQRAFAELQAWIQSLPRDRDCYGLVHGDLHGGNLLLDEGRLTALDFDDSCQHWLVYDLAVPLFYARLQAARRPGSFDPAAFARTLTEAYSASLPTPPAWLARIPGMTQLRTAELYAWCTASLARRRLPPAAVQWATACRDFCASELNDRATHKVGASLPRG